SDRVVELEALIKTNPVVQLELASLQRSKLQPENIVFAHKDSLYRKEEKVRRIIPVRWMRIAAAVLLFALITTAVLVINRKPSSGSGTSDIVKKGNTPATNNVKEEASQENDDNKTVNSTSPDTKD